MKKPITKNHEERVPVVLPSCPKHGISLGTWVVGRLSAEADGAVGRLLLEAGERAVR